MSQESSLRIIDANLNRAREALRVMEEYARLGLDDAGLSSSIKETRHALAAAVGEMEDGLWGDATGKLAQASPNGGFHSACGSGGLIRSRDIVGDVGCDVATATEYEREDALHVALAAGKRLSEALRCVEEYGKVIAPSFAAAVEKIRYRGYELERRLHVISSARARFAKIQLYVIIIESLCAGDWFATAEAALQGGADCLQLREKNLADGELLDRAKRLATLCHEQKALLIVNDRPDIAALSGADGVHLGQEDMSIAAARRILPLNAIVGVSTHTIEQVQAAAEQAPDYIAVGPMFATATKPQDHIAGPGTLSAARERTSLPLVAIGGIGENNMDSILTAAHCIVCVCGAVIGASDTRGVASRLARSMGRRNNQTTFPKT